jgi:hypothetical protein
VQTAQVRTDLPFNRSGSSATNAPTETRPKTAVSGTPNAAPVLSLILHGLFYCYLCGVFLFGANFLLQLLVLCYQSYTKPSIRDGRFRIIETTGNRAPCSFGINIFINPSLYDPETYQQILIHEKIHVSGCHTLDILLAEIAIVLQWFNPFVWLYRREVENNLEFLTDQSVLHHRDVDRSTYQLSLLRVSAPQLPFSITNNYNQSLLKRRIVMMNSKRSSQHTVWKYFFLLPLLTALVCTLNKPAVSSPTVAVRLRPTVGAPANRVVPTDTTPAVSAEAHSAVSVSKESVSKEVRKATEAHAAISEAISAQASVHTSDNIHLSGNSGNIDFKEGPWFVTTRGSKLEFELKAGDEENSWQSSFSVEKSEIDPFPGQGTVEFKLVREAGTMVFKGQFDGQQGFGHFVFQPDAAYFNAVKQLGVDDVEGHGEGSFFTNNIRKEYIVMLQRSGYTPLRRHEVIGLSAMHIDEDFLRYWKGSGVEGTEQVHNLITLKALNIDRAYVDELKAAGYDHLAVHQLVSLKSQHIDGPYIRSLGAPSGGSPIPPNELISFKAMNIDSAYLSSLKKLGYDHLTRSEIMSMFSMHITADFIKGFMDVGFTNIPPHTLITLKSMDITPEFAKGFRDLGYTDLEASRLASLKSMGITPEYVKEFNKIGYQHIPMSLLTSLKATGVNADYVSKMKEKGFDSMDLTKYLRLKQTFN